jgi:hypothetical protein
MMIEVKVERELEFGAKAVWALIADFGDVSWVPGVEKVELEGEGVGMIRHLTVPTLPQLHERMDAIDYEKMILDYSIPAVAFLAVTNYHARAQVFPIDGASSKVIWSCRAEAEGVEDAEAVSKTEAFYDAVLTWIPDHLRGEDDG